MAVKVNDDFVGTVQDSNNRSGLVSLARRQMKMKRMPLPISEEIDLCRKIATGAT